MTPHFPIYDYVSVQGRNDFKDWSSRLQNTERAKLNEHIDKLMLYGEGLYPRLPTDTSVPGILKIRITAAKVQLRPLLCRQPVNPGNEYTFLLGAKERGNKWSPTNALTIAVQNKLAIVAYPGAKRTRHEKVL